MTSPDDSFSRQGVDPVSRCLHCGAAIAAEGRQQHLAWHQGISDLVMQLMITFGG